MKIAVMIPTLLAGGAERSSINLAAGLRRAGTDVSLVTMLSSANTFLSEVDASVPVLHMNCRRRWLLHLYVKGYIEQCKPDVIISSLANKWVVAGAMLARRGGHCPKVIISEKGLFSALAVKDGHPSVRVGARLAPFFYRRADRVVAVSKVVADDLVAQGVVPAGHVQVIYDPVVTKEFWDALAAAPGENYLAEEGPNIVAIGRLEAVKNYRLLLEAFVLLRRERPCHLVIFGEGVMRGELEELVTLLGLQDDVLLPGFVQNPFPYLARADCLVSSSLTEALPGVIIQALACGTNIVATDCPGGMREILTDGRYGRLVPLGEPAAMAGAMAAAIDDPLPREALRERGMFFSEQRSVQAYLALSRELTGEDFSRA